MKDFKIDNKGTTRLFSNKILEGLTRTNFILPVVGYYILAVFFLVISYFDTQIHFIHALWIIPLGAITFTLFEYLIHRFVFHFHAATEKQMNIQYHIHGVHHEFPRDKDRLVMPPVVSILLSVGFYYLFKVTMADYGMLFFSGFIGGYSSYLIVHYAVHALKPPNNFLKFYWKHHSLHHYDSVNSAFSVSLPFWDFLFGTLPGPRGRSGVENENRLPDYN